MPLAIEDILDGARAMTGGLANPDGDSWREGLEILRYHQREVRLTERGWASVRDRYVLMPTVRDWTSEKGDRP
jgi:hypothetical protein